MQQQKMAESQKAMIARQLEMQQAGRIGVRLLHQLLYRYSRLI
jgi:hypothetical protein